MVKITIVKYLLVQFLIISNDTFKSIIQQPIEIHQINVASLQPAYMTSKKQRILTYSPFKRATLTLKAGLNSNILSKVNMDALNNDNNIKMAFNDFNADDVYNTVKYEGRFKYYINERLKFLVRIQMFGVKEKLYNDIYNFGFIYKI